MFSNERLLSLFNLINKNDTKITCKSLSEKLNVTERTIRNDITSINYLLKDHGAIIKIKRCEGYYIDILDLNKYQEFLANNSKNIMYSNNIPNSPENRYKYILKFLLYSNNYAKVDDLASNLFVSKLTILNDIKRIKGILSKYNLTIVSKPYYGIIISGKESDIRKCISHNIIEKNFNDYIIGFTENEKEIFSSIDLEELQKIILTEINKASLEFSDINLKNFMIHIAITISRLLLNKKINLEDDTTISKDYKIEDNIAVNNICAYIINKYNLSIEKEDMLYIYNHFNLKCNSSDNNINNEIINYTSELLQVIYDTYNFDLRNDKVLFNDLKIHFKSILNPKYLDENKVNPLLKTIKSNYPLSFEITFTSIKKIFENTIYSFNEDEIGYVSLHIGAAMERFFQNNVSIKNTIIVCGSGYGTSRLLEAQITKVFHNKLNIVECLSLNQFNSKHLKNIDLIISTIPITHKEIPVVLVDFILLNKDIQNISKAITYQNNYFDKNLFLVHPNVKDKNELLNLMCDTLLKNEIVSASFKDSIFCRENLSSTNLNNFLAIPHPMELSATKTKLCIAILNNYITWKDESSVKVVIMLAINKNDYFHMDNAYNILIKIISDDYIQNKLSLCKSYEDFTSIISDITK